MYTLPSFISALAQPPLRTSTFLPDHNHCARVAPRAVTLAAPRRVAHAPRRCSVSATAVPVDVVEDTFEDEVLNSEVPVLVDFYAPWCGPCKLVSPLMDWAANEFAGKLKVAKVDTDENASFVQKYNIHGLPTFAVFKNGKATGIREGAMGKVGLESYILEYAPEVA